jgi:hypothetical protein
MAPGRAYFGFLNPDSPMICVANLWVRRIASGEYAAFAHPAPFQLKNQDFQAAVRSWPLLSRAGLPHGVGLSAR